ncbi:Tat pathway signal sequence domain-containing protein [Mycena chlorophos]|uniref:Tat pathway signal sequence domain-containing protein n=1 Tax=Mycena chlorophos TaxID=658473 RepID=A0A8H6SJB4_MYCCL|nr:Tat pathway signal sequence domain-containing protein [Mycena chlorophos]
MRLLTASLLSFAASSGLVAASGCPYATPEASAVPSCPYAARAPSADVPPLQARGPAANGKRGVMYHNRIAPNGAQLYIANADGTDAHELMPNESWAMDYHANWSPDGKWIVFSSERRADGQTDIYRVRPNGKDVELLVATDAVDDIGSLSPDGTKLVYVSTSINHTANVFVMDLKTRKSWNVTGSDETVGNKASPHGFFRPSWSPNGEWIAMSSDRNTGWTGHSNGTGWEHTQLLGLYIVRPDGRDFRAVVTDPAYSLGTPKWSPDGRRLSYSNMTLENTYNAHSFAGVVPGVVSQIYSVDVATGKDIKQLTHGDVLVQSQSYIGNTTNVGYIIKSALSGSVAYTHPDVTHKDFVGTVRNPSWNPTGKKIVYEVPNWTIRKRGKPLYSWDSEWEYRFSDDFPTLNYKTGRMAISAVQTPGPLNGNGSVVTSWGNFSDAVDSFDSTFSGNQTIAELLSTGLSGAFQPTFSPDGSQIAVGLGVWFFDRVLYPGQIYLANTNGTGHKTLTDNLSNVGFPSFSPDGTKIVYRAWNSTWGPLGLHILDLTTGKTTQLTNGWDNTPGWSPDGKSIVFARQSNWTTEYGGRWYADRFDVYTINPDGTHLERLTESDANDAHPVWTHDNRIMYGSGMHGFRDECAIYESTFQPYGAIMIMNRDGSNKTVLTDSLWEDAMPLYVSNEFLG